MRIIHQAFKYLSVGVINTGLGLVIIFAFQLLGFNYIFANLSGYAIGLIFSFVLNRFWSFRVKGRVSVLELASFILIFLAAYSANLVVVTTLVELLDVSAYLSQVFGVVVYGIVNFVGLKCVVFTGR